MKTAFVLLATLAVVASLAIVPHKELSLKCQICEDVCVDTESWSATALENDESALIGKCEKALGAFATLFCDDFVKTELDALIAHMANPATEKTDCTHACELINLC
uniref:Saposin B-type domain-containing protein n=1 Tax=Panagrellus redivivus TaxID=6233 RepID=A0A7E4ZZE3_PANRE